MTISAVVPTLERFRSKILKIKDEDNDTVRELKSSIMAYLERHYTSNDHLSELLNIATFLDPRFKSSFNADISSTVQTLVHKVKRVPENANPRPAALPNKSSSSSAVNWNNLLGSDEQIDTVNEISSEERLVSEVQHYNSLPILHDKNINPLTWWAMNKCNFPMLSCLAKQYLCIPATSVASERAFSKAGYIVSCRRTCLKPTMVNMLLFLNQNL